MSFLDAKNLTKNDLQNLVDEKISENKELEYKDYTFENGKMKKLADKQKDKLMKEVVAFANTNGGTIIIGIKESEDRFPTELSGVGFGMKYFDEWLSSFRQLVLSRIRPHLHGVECIPIELDENNIVIAIFVPKSYARPHSFWDGNKDEFFIRYANGITYMDIEDLRKAFLYLNSVQNKIVQFRKERISMILANECVGDLGNDGKLVIHIIPEWSFELGNKIDINYLENNTQLRPIMVRGGWDYRFNADGYCTYNCSETNSINTYTQVFHNGIIEAVEIRLISYKERQVYDWLDTQRYVIEAIQQYVEILQDLGVPKPWHISASLLNAKGYITIKNSLINSFPIERNIVNSLEGIYTEDNTMKDALQPVFDSLSNAFGFRNSSCFAD